jgi:hypothetical protein
MPFLGLLAHVKFSMKKMDAQCWPGWEVGNLHLLGASVKHGWRRAFQDCKTTFSKTGE